MERTAVREEEQSGRAIRERESPLSLTVTSDPHQSLGLMGAADGERRRSPLRLSAGRNPSSFFEVLETQQRFFVVICSCEFSRIEVRWNQRVCEGGVYEIQNNTITGGGRTVG